MLPLGRSLSSPIAGVAQTIGGVFPVSTTTGDTAIMVHGPHAGVVNVSVFFGADYLKILRAVVGRVTIDMVNLLVSKQLSAECLFHDEAMFTHAPAIFGSNEDVATDDNASTAVPSRIAFARKTGAVAGETTELTTSTNSRWLSKELFGAGLACAEYAWGILTGHRKFTPFGVMPPAVSAARGLLVAPIIPQFEEMDNGNN